jgi:hypothetical protein
VAVLTNQAQAAALRDNPEEGPAVAEGDVAALRKAYGALGAAAQAWVARLSDEAARNRSTFHMSQPSVRRFEIARALVSAAPSLCEDKDDETLRAILAAVLGPVARMPFLTAGAIVGSLNYVEAAIFATCVDEYLFTDIEAAVAPDGTISLLFAE